ncbi:hypothetical protein [Polaromonas naphthalenivorans]|nr:hypothetical protein [Polaromonas naphthalenivorans]
MAASAVHQSAASCAFLNLQEATGPISLRCLLHRKGRAWLSRSNAPAAKVACLCYKNYMNSFLTRATQELKRTFGVVEAEVAQGEKDVTSNERQVEATVLALVPEYHLVKVIPLHTSHPSLNCRA